MSMPRPADWIVWCSCILPAAFSLALDAWLRALELKGKLGGNELGEAPEAGLYTLLVCAAGCLLPAIWLTRDEEKKLTVILVRWGSLVIFNVILTIPGCTMLWK